MSVLFSPDQNNQSVRLLGVLSVSCTALHQQRSQTHQDTTLFMTQGSRDSRGSSANPHVSVPETQVLPMHPAHKVCPGVKGLLQLTGPGIAREQNTQVQPLQIPSWVGKPNRRRPGLLFLLHYQRINGKPHEFCGIQSPSSTYAHILCMVVSQQFTFTFISVFFFFFAFDMTYKGVYTLF